METTQKYDNYPVWIVISSNMVSLSTYGLGFFIMYHLGLAVSIIYLMLVLIFEYRLLSKHCVSCFYWGRTCGFGKGRISSAFFKRGDPSKFCNSKMTWKDLLPDLLISLVPVITGVVLLIIKFDLIVLFAAVMLIALTTIGNGYIRGTLTCPNCKQKELGCPAEKLFNKDK